MLTTTIDLVCDRSVMKIIGGCLQKTLMLTSTNDENHPKSQAQIKPATFRHHALHGVQELPGFNFQFPGYTPR